MRLLLSFTPLILLLCGCSGSNPLPQQEVRAKVLLFTRTSGFRHDSIPQGIAMIRQLGVENRFDVDASEDSSIFNDANLSNYSAVIFLNTTGDILTPDQKSSFERYIRAGKGYVGIHSATDTEYSWAWYGGLVGAYFRSHPQIQPANIRVDDPSHPLTSSLGTSWSRTDEWYDFAINPRNKVHVLLTLDEASYSGGTMGGDHPLSWCQIYDGGRAWYTAGGHTQESYSEPLYRQHVLAGIQYAAGVMAADCAPPLS